MGGWGHEHWQARRVRSRARSTRPTELPTPNPEAAASRPGPGLAALFVGVWVDSRLLWWTLGLVSGGILILAIDAWDRPPEHVAKWLRGATGERWTACELRPLEREGWTIQHDIDHGCGNIDHLAEGPRGIFLLETKTLRGTISVAEGLLQTVQIDDPDEIYRPVRLRSTVLGKAKEESERRRAKNGRAPWVQGVVVIWGNFPQRRVRDEVLAYVHGDELADWLRTFEKLPRRPV